MDLKFTADEVFAMAEQIEANGAKYYRKAAEGFEDEEAKKLLLSLADMEDDHLKTFSGMREELSSHERESSVFDPYGEAGLYLRAMADDHVFNVDLDPSSELTGHETLDDILKNAIRLEKDSILFYLGIKAAISRRKGREKIDDIIEEEFGHIATLSNELSVLSK